MYLCSNTIRSLLSNGIPTRFFFLCAGAGERNLETRIEPLLLPTMEEIRGQDIWNNCAVRSVVSGIMGGGLGLFMGMFLGALDNPLMEDEMSGKQQLIYTAKQMRCRSLNSAKTSALMGLIFSAAECVVEKARAKHDMTNSVADGRVTGVQFLQEEYLNLGEA